VAGKPMQTTPAAQLEAARERHRTETRREILLPAVLGLGVLALAIVAVLVFANRNPQISLIADFTLSLLVLCPAALCMLPLALGLVVAAVGMNRVHDWVDDKSGAVVRGSYSLNRRIDRIMDKLGRFGVEFGARAAPLESQVFSAFDRPSGTVETEVTYEPTATQRRQSVGRPEQRED